MDPKRWSRPISFQASGSEELKTITDTKQAAVVLESGWPVARGRSLRSAKRTCQQVLDGRQPPSAARNAFIAAAVEAHVFVREQ